MNVSKILFSLALSLAFCLVLMQSISAESKDLLERLKVPPRFGKRGADASTFDKGTQFRNFCFDTKSISIIVQTVPDRTTIRKCHRHCRFGILTKSWHRRLLSFAVCCKAKSRILNSKFVTSMNDNNSNRTHYSEKPFSNQIFLL